LIIFIEFKGGKSESRRKVVRNEKRNAQLIYTTLNNLVAKKLISLVNVV